MKCRVCGGSLRPNTTDLPLKVSDRTIVIFKGLPVLQCEACAEYVLDDAVMAKIDERLAQVDAAAELEIIPYAA